MEVALVILLGEEAGLAIDSALNDVQRVIGEKNARAAWHLRCSESQMSLTPIVIKCLGPFSSIVEGGSDRRFTTALTVQTFVHTITP